MISVALFIFFEDDCNIERFWNNPKAYIAKLKRFQGIIGPDYSVCWDFPVVLKNYNHWRNSVCTYWLQHQLKYAAPQARCEDDDFTAVLAGFPRHSTIAIGARSMVRRLSDRYVLKNLLNILLIFLSLKICFGTAVINTVLRITHVRKEYCACIPS